MPGHHNNLGIAAPFPRPQSVSIGKFEVMTHRCDHGRLLHKRIVVWEKPFP